MARVVVSFKQTTKDMQLYLKVKNMEEQSAFIKQAIEFYLEYLEKKKDVK